MNLADGEGLHLEVAEDYAIVTDAALKGTQVRDTAGSGSLTLQSLNVRKALDAFVDLIKRNAGRTVYFHYLTTSEIATERNKSQRVGDEADFVHDQLATGKKLRVLTVVDTFSRYVPVLDPR
ncbi:hypothetical protein, partial [Agrobacterium tumefaciens]|uniref:hypothetical protein n=1 Tax=Agrobacterium tumefaciens TaxID=358 RepID=UPI001573BC73